MTTPTDDPNHHNIPLDTLRARAIQDPDVPESVRRFLQNGAPLDEIRLDASGNWHHQGEPFINQRLSSLFHRSLHQTAAGNWILRVHPYTYPVLVDATGRFILRLHLDKQTPTALLADGRTVDMAAEDLVTDGDTFVGAWIRPDHLLARCVRSAWATVEERLDQDEQGFFLRGRSTTFRLSLLDSSPLLKPAALAPGNARDC